MKSKILNLLLLTTILLMHLEGIAAPQVINGTYPGSDPGSGDGDFWEESDVIGPSNPETDTTGSDQGNNNDNTETDATQSNNNPTVRAPVPIGAVVVSIAVVLYMVYRGVERD